MYLIDSLFNNSSANSMLVHGILNMYIKIKIRRLALPSPVLDSIEVLTSAKHLVDREDKLLFFIP
jgi:hypothetical protein